MTATLKEPTRTTVRLVLGARDLAVDRVVGLGDFFVYSGRVLWHSVTDVVLRLRFRKTVLTHVSDIVAGAGAFVVGGGMVFVVATMALAVGATVGVQAFTGLSQIGAESFVGLAGSYANTREMAGEPVLHVSFHEAEAYAAWAGKRLPTEPEWEKAARHDPATGRSLRYPWGDEEPTAEHANLGQLHLRPAVAGAYPKGASPLGVHQLIGDVWEWTSSDFTGYPGFAAFPYREYSEVFFGPGYKVLRGGSFGTDAVAIRGTFRNWDYPIRRQIFSGFRCARDLRPEERG